jgi:hypothetical protein
MHENDWLRASPLLVVMHAKVAELHVWHGEAPCRSLRRSLRTINRRQTPLCTGQFTCKPSYTMRYEAPSQQRKNPTLTDEGGICEAIWRFPEATTGFEPVMRVLQTLALPLGDVAAMERETGFEPATFSLARRCSTPEPLPHCCVPALSRRLPNYTAPAESLSSRQPLSLPGHYTPITPAHTASASATCGASCAILKSVPRILLYIPTK